MNIATTVQSSSLSQPFTLNRVYRIFVPLDDEFECEKDSIRYDIDSIDIPFSEKVFDRNSIVREHQTCMDIRDSNYYLY